MENEHKQFIIQLSSEAGQFLRNNFYTLKNTVAKSDGGVATNVELELASIIRKRINDVYPDHGIKILGLDDSDESKEYVWVVDPLDGSEHFSRNIPLYTVNIALRQNGETVLATVNSPHSHQLYFAEKSHGAYLNGLRIAVSEQNQLKKAYLFVELPESKFSNQPSFGASFEERMAKIKKLVQEVGQVESFRIGALGQCLVAAGSFDAYADFSGSSLEINQAASRLIVEEAGGVVMDLAETGQGFVQYLVTNKQLEKSLTQIIHD